MKIRCIKCTSIWHLTQKEPTSCKKSSLHSELCDRHSGELENAPASYLPVHYQADGPWRARYQRMVEFQAEIDRFPARFGRDIIGGQLATIAEYALNVFSLRHRQTLDM